MRGSCIEKNRCRVAINKKRTENDVGILLSFFGRDTVDMLLDNNEPTSYGEAMVGPDSNKWLEAIKSERIHVDRLGVLSWLLVLVWALVCPMFLRTTSKAAILLLIFLLTILLEGSILLDSVISLEPVEILLHNIGARRTLCPFHV